MISHISFGVADLGLAITFYDVVLDALGYQRLWTTDRGAGYGIDGAHEPFAIFEAGSQTRAPGVGCHLAFTASSAEDVEAFHRAALRLGGKNEGLPGLRPHYGAGYYAAFVRDLDGYKLEAVFHGPGE